MSEKSKDTINGPTRTFRDPSPQKVREWLREAEQQAPPAARADTGRVRTRTDNGDTTIWVEYDNQ